MGNLGAQVSGLASALNAEGQKVVDAFRTDTRNIFAGSVMLTQPVFMGGSIVAMNKMARLGEQMARSGIDAKRQQTIYEADRAYWAIVSLKHKQRLAQSYLELVSRLDGDVQKMIRQGVATRSDGLSVKVKVNEAQMSLTQVNDGLALARMLLCQICGLPLDTDITLADEEADSLVLGDATMTGGAGEAMQNRPELQMLQATVDISRQATNLVKAGRLPQVALMGGYSFSNPNVFNGFQNKFGGVWSVGVLVRVPIWNWGDVAYKVKAAKAATAIASLELAEAREGVELQVSQSSFKVSEAARKLAMARASAEQAEENLRSANLGFREGVIQSTTVMEAQTAWVKAQSQKIDAEIEVKLSQVNLRKRSWYIRRLIMSAKSQHNNILLAVAGFAAVVVVVAAIGFLALGREPELIQGQVEVTEYRVSSKVPGRVLELRVKEGDYVRKGDTLVILDAPDVEAKLAQARSAEDAASALDEMARRGARAEQVRGAYQVLQQAKAGHEIALKSYQRVQRLFDEGGHDGAEARRGLCQLQGDGSAGKGRAKPV